MECNVCKLRFQKPVVILVCGHSFCFSCLEEWRKCQGCNFKCPTCRHKVHVDDMSKVTRNYAFEALLDIRIHEHEWNLGHGYGIRLAELTEDLEDDFEAFYDALANECTKAALRGWEKLKKLLPDSGVGLKVRTLNEKLVDDIKAEVAMVGLMRNQKAAPKEDERSLISDCVDNVLRRHKRELEELLYYENHPPWLSDEKNLSEKPEFHDHVKRVINAVPVVAEEKLVSMPPLIDLTLDEDNVDDAAAPQPTTSTGRPALVNVFDILRKNAQKAFKLKRLGDTRRK